MSILFISIKKKILVFIIFIINSIVRGLIKPKHNSYYKNIEKTS